MLALNVSFSPLSFVTQRNFARAKKSFMGELNNKLQLSNAHRVNEYE